MFTGGRFVFKLSFGTSTYWLLINTTVGLLEIYDVFEQDYGIAVGLRVTDMDDLKNLIKPELHGWSINTTAIGDRCGCS